jgi:hypothetical protein
LFTEGKDQRKGKPRRQHELVSSKFLCGTISTKVFRARWPYQELKNRYQSRCLRFNLRIDIITSIIIIIYIINKVREIFIASEITLLSTREKISKDVKTVHILLVRPCTY